MYVYGSPSSGAPLCAGSARCHAKATSENGRRVLAPASCQLVSIPMKLGVRITSRAFVTKFFFHYKKNGGGVVFANTQIFVHTGRNGIDTYNLYAIKA